MDDPFEGEKVRLRPFEPDDVPVLAGYLNHPQLIGRRYLPWGFPDVATLSHQQIEAIYRKWAAEEEGMAMAIVLRESGQIIGHAECSWDWDAHGPSASLVIAPGYQRRGYGTEALGLMLGYLFDYTPAHVVACWIAEWNEPALRFVARHGFRANGRMRRVGLHAGRYFDTIVTDILRAERKERGGGGHAA